MMTLTQTMGITHLSAPDNDRTHSLHLRDVVQNLQSTRLSGVTSKFSTRHRNYIRILIAAAMINMVASMDEWKTARDDLEQVLKEMDMKINHLRAAVGTCQQRLTDLVTAAPSDHQEPPTRMKEPEEKMDQNDTFISPVKSNLAADNGNGWDAKNAVFQVDGSNPIGGDGVLLKEHRVCGKYTWKRTIPKKDGSHVHIFIHSTYEQTVNSYLDEWEPANANSVKGGERKGCFIRAVASDSQSPPHTYQLKYKDTDTRKPTVVLYRDFTSAHVAEGSSIVRNYNTGEKAKYTTISPIRVKQVS